MITKTFRRTLSIIICAAMLVSVFAVSFTVSAATGVSSSTTEVVYSWDYTDTTNGADYVTETKDKGTYYNDNGTKLQYDSTNGCAAYASTDTNFNSLIFEAPANCTPSELTAVTPNNSDCGNNIGAGSVVLGYIKRGTETNLCKFWIASLYWSWENYSKVAYHIQDMNRKNLLNGAKNCEGSAAPDKFKNLLTKDGVSTGSEKYSDAGLNVSLDDIKNGKLTYTYKTEINSTNNSITLNATITYKKDDSTTYTTSIVPIEIGLSDLQDLDSTITGFTPALGIGRDFWGTRYASQFYSLNVKFTKNTSEECTQHVAADELANQKAATCSEEGYTGDVVCKNCGAVMTAGETIKALGHDWKEDTTNSGNKAATCATTGLQYYKCSRCDETKSEEIAKTAHSWSDWTITKEASETEEGEKTRTCSVCKATETEKISKTSTSEYTWTFNKDADTAEKDLTGMLNHSDYINGATNDSFAYNSDDKVLYINGEGDILENRYFRGLIFKNITDNTGVSLKPNKLTVESPMLSESTSFQSITSNTGVAIGETYRSETGETRNVFVSFEPQIFNDCEANLRITECLGTHDNDAEVTNKIIHLQFKKENGQTTSALQDVFGTDFTWENFGDLTCKYVADIDDNQNVNITVTVTYTYTNSDGETQNISAEAETVTINLENLQTYESNTYNKQKTGYFGKNITSFEPILGIARFLNNASGNVNSKLNYVSAEYVPYKLSATAQVVLDSGIYLRINPKAEGSINTDTIKIYVDGEEKSTGTSAYNIEKYAHQMTDSMLIRLTAETTTGTACSYTINNGSYSIADNLENLYNNSDYDSFKPLIAKLANYGAAAQAYDELANNMTYSKKANEFLDETAKVTSDDAYKTFESCTASGSFYDAESDVFNSTNFKAGLSLALQGKVKMVVLVSKITISEGQTLSVKMGDETADFEYDESRGLYTAVFGTFSPKDYGETKSIQLVLKNSDGTEAATSGTAGYSVGAYINRMAQKNVTAELKTLLNALAEYQVEFAKMYNA